MTGKEKTMRKPEGVSIGDMLFEARHAAGWTVAEVARKLGFSSSYVSDLEQDAVKYVTFERLAAIRQLYDLNGEQLLIAAGYGADQIEAVRQLFTGSDEE
jgi:transcriptional regulator with XRE-family HTH domain